MGTTPEEMRREFLKGYIGALFFQGKLSGVGSVTAIVQRTLQCVQEDAAVVAQELTELILRQGAEHYGGMVRERLETFAGDLQRLGFRGVWKKIQAQYARGVEANGRRSTDR